MVDLLSWINQEGQTSFRAVDSSVKINRRINKEVEKTASMTLYLVSSYLNIAILSNCSVLDSITHLATAFIWLTSCPYLDSENNNLKQYNLLD